MNLVLSAEQKLLKTVADSFFREKGGVARLRKLLGEPDPKAALGLWREVAELGWVGMCAPEAAGGAGLGLAEQCLVAEAAGRVLAPEPLIGCGLFAVDLLAAASASVLPAVLAGEAIATVAWDERGMRGDLARAATSARPGATGSVIDGEKCDVVAAAAANLLIVAARHSETGSLGVYTVAARAPGVAIAPQRRIDGLPVARVSFAGAVATDHIGDDAALRRAIDRATVAQAAELVGIAGAAFELTLQHLRDRQQFGVAIGTFQALRHRAARLYIALELARSSVMAAARMLDVAGPARAQAPRDLAQTVSLAKARASDAALQVADESVQMHGGIGMTDEHDIGLYYKRARVAATTYGSAADHRDRWATLAGY